MEDRHPSTITGPVSEAERTYAIEMLLATRDSLRQSVGGLSLARQHYKPAPDTWSIAECVEHIVVVDRGIFKGLQLGMNRSEERRVGKECVQPCRSRWSPYH